MTDRPIWPFEGWSIRDPKDGDGSAYPMKFEKEPEVLPDVVTADSATEEVEYAEYVVEGRSRLGTITDPRLRSPDLIPRHLTSATELATWERVNVSEAVIWTRRTDWDPLKSESIRELHRRMFDRTWRWAGRLREPDPLKLAEEEAKRVKTRAGIELAPPPTYAPSGGPGARAERITEEIAKLIWSGSGWFERGSVPARDALLRLHHTLVRIRAFEGGNGRHARLWCDWVAASRGLDPIAWLGDHETPATVIRERYREALQEADGGDYEPLNRLYGVMRLGPITTGLLEEGA